MRFKQFHIAKWQWKSSEKTTFSYKVYGNVANYFDDAAGLLEFFDFKKGDVIVEVGAFDGANIGGFSLLVDINDKVLNQKKLDKIIRHNSKIKNSVLTNKFHLCIGTEKATNLPDSIFDKIIVISALHEFTYMNEMIYDFNRKLKKHGKIYLLESFAIQKGIKITHQQKLFYK
ncbi:MAG: hypothetical protein H0X62_05535 [Bacteroidetes bacterium]|nr:hypothetical protein [Bacteroidota bacterium]